MTCLKVTGAYLVPENNLKGEFITLFRSDESERNDHENFIKKAIMRKISEYYFNSKCELTQVTFESEQPYFATINAIVEKIDQSFVFSDYTRMIYDDFTLDPENARYVKPTPVLLEKISSIIQMHQKAIDKGNKLLKDADFKWGKG